MQLPNPENTSELISFANRAMLGEIRPNIRSISIEYIKDTNTITLYFYFDRELTQAELDYDIPGTISAELIADYPSSLGINWKEEIIIIPYPKHVNEKGICIYSRYEATPDEFL